MQAATQSLCDQHIKIRCVEQDCEKLQHSIDEMKEQSSLKDVEIGKFHDKIRSLEENESKLQHSIDEKNNEIASLQADRAAAAKMLCDKDKEIRCAKDDYQKILGNNTQSSSKQMLKTPIKTPTGRKRSSPRSVSHGVKSKKKTKNDWGVEQLLDHEIRSGIIHYRVRWEGYDAKDDTWEPEHNLKCPKILLTYKQANKLK